MATLAAFAFAAGAALLQQQPALPALGWVLVLPLCAAGVLARSALAVPAALAAGFLWAAGFAHLRLAEQIDAALEGRDLKVVGVVTGLPATSERGTRFEFEIESSEAGARLPPKVLLSWYRSAFADTQAAPLAPALRPGERWLLTVRLRRPHGNVNPHGFDYEAWLLERGIGATGYVRPRAEQRKLGERSTFFDRITLAREAVRGRFYAVLGVTPAAGVLVGLAVGDQRSISNEEWQLFNRTGVTHLMSISGLHVTLVSGLFAAAVGFGWRRSSRLCHRVPARKAAALAAIAAALGYTLLAGFAIPAQRTFYMVTVVALALWSGRVASPARTLGLALVAVVLADPWAPLAPGFWLSFGAVALIFYIGTGWSTEEPLPVQWVRVQWAITLGLAPAVLLLFGHVSIAGPLANALAIPAVSALITPIALLAAVIPLGVLLELAAWLVQWLLQYLEWCAALPFALWHVRVPPLWAVILGLGGVAWLLAPRGVPWRACGLALLAPAFAFTAAAPAKGEAWITTLDVGQGLAVLVRTATRALLYDAGPTYGAHGDSGARIVVPVLRAAGVARLDALVVSHDDTDHLGGAQSVLEALEVDALLSSLSRSHSLNAFARAASSCTAGRQWEWDGVRFAFLHPQGETPAGARARNEASCVLRVTTAGGTMLLTGDIEAGAEAALVQHAGEALRNDVLLAPHHGARASSGRDFIAAVEPRWVVISAGARNRFGHPSPEALARYRSAGAAVLRTDRDGAVTVRLAPGGVRAETQADKRARYWRSRPDG